jgi:hypothetical protein
MSVVLPIEQDDRFRILTASAGQTVLAITFPWQDDNDIGLLKQVDGDWVQLSRPANYSLIGAGEPSGGSATLTTPALEGEKYLVLGAAILDRLSSIVRDGRFNSKNIDDELDRNRIIQQEQARDLGRAVKVGFGEQSQDLPSPDGVSLIGWGPDNKLINRPGEGESAAAAEAAAEAALAAANAGFVFATEADFEIANIPPVLQFVRTAGYYSPGDGGGHTKVRRAGPLTPAPGLKFVSGAWWEISEERPNPIMFGAVRGDAGPSHITNAGPALEEWADFINATRGSWEILPGAYLCDRTIYIDDPSKGSGLGALGRWETPFFDLASMEIEKGVTIIMTGTGPKDQTLDFCSSMRHSGAFRVNPNRSYNNAFDQYFEAADFTNGDAVGATKATLKPFSAGIVFGRTGLSSKTIACNIRVVPRCDDGINGPLAGYLAANMNAYIPWDQWDVGILIMNPYTANLQDMQAVGYWHMNIGILQTSIRFGSAPTGGRGETCLIERCDINGYSVRQGDPYPVLSKTANSVTIAWSRGHRFNPSGSIFIDSVSYAYTGLTYSAVGEGSLTFTGIADTSAVVTSGGGRSVLHMTNNNGTTQTEVSDSHIRDFHHPSLVERPSPAFGAQAGKYQAAIELVGYPMRGILFKNNTMYTHNPMFLLMQGCREVKFRDGTYEEKAYRTALGGPLNPDGLFQGLAICGPDQAHQANWPDLLMGSVELEGYAWSGRLNIGPVGIVAPGRRYSSFNDVFNPFFFDPGNVFGNGRLYDRREPSEITVSGGVLTAYKDVHAVDTEGDAATDEVDTINAPWWITELTLFPSSSGRITTYKDGTGNLNLFGQDVRVGGGQSLTIFKRGSTWYLKNFWQTRYLEGTLVYDPPSLADGAGADAFVTVTGAALGDLCIASFSVNVAGITKTADVVNANTVRVRFQNESGGTLDLGSGTIRVRVIK